MARGQGRRTAGAPTQRRRSKLRIAWAAASADPLPGLAPACAACAQLAARSNTLPPVLARVHLLLRGRQVENFGALRYERSREVAAHGRVLTQRHEATNAEIAMNAGDRPLVGVGGVAVGRAVAVAARSMGLRVGRGAWQGAWAGRDAIRAPRRGAPHASSRHGAGVASAAPMRPRASQVGRDAADAAFNPHEPASVEYL